MKSKKKWICLTAVVVAMSFSMLFCKLYVMRPKKVSTDTSNIQSTQILYEQASINQAPMFWVSAYDGRVKVEDLSDANASILLKNVDIRSMRNVDRVRFETGFYLYSEEELVNLLEDYSS